MAVERLAGELAVGGALAIERALARAPNAAGDDALASPSAAPASCAGGDRRHLDLDVDPVEQRPADLALVAQHRVGRAAARVVALPSWPHGHGFIAATSWNAAGKSACRAARDTTMRPVSSGSRSASSAARGNSASSSRKRTPRWASDASPGRGGEPPPTSAAADAV